MVDDSFRQAELMRRRHRRVPPPRSTFAGFRFPREVIVLAMRWYLRYGTVLPRRGRTARRTRHRGGSRHGLPVGAALHTVVDRRGMTVPTCAR